MWQCSYKLGNLDYDLSAYLPPYARRTKSTRIGYLLYSHLAAHVSPRHGVKLRGLAQIKYLLQPPIPRFARLERGFVSL